MPYMLFAYDNYYPGGGMNDHQATFSDLDEFQHHDIYLDYDNFQIFDTYNGNKSTLYMYRKVEEADPCSMEEEKILRQKYLEKFVSEFIEE